jgi:hypothetical protein
LSLQVICDLRNGVPLRVPLVRGNVFISAAEHHRLQDDPVDLLDVIGNESNDVANSIIVQSVHDGHLECGLHAGSCDIVEGTELQLHVVADSAVTVLFVSNPVELQIDSVKSGGSSLGCKISLLSEANSVGRHMEPMETDAFGVLDGVQEYRR